jgi:hypothetical protein
VRRQDKEGVSAHDAYEASALHPCIVPCLAARSCPPDNPER